MTSITNLLDSDKKIVDNVTNNTEFSYSININEIQLTTNALDDYQRLFFTTFVLNNNIENNVDYRIKIINTVYKSTLMPGLSRPPYLPEEFIDSGYDYNFNEKKHQKTTKRNKSDNLLHCQEYSLPNVNINNLGESIDLNLNELDSKFRNNFKINDIEKNVPILNGRIFFDDDINDKTVPSQKVNEVKKELLENVDSDNVVYAITKNKQYKMRNIMHKNNQIKHIVNPNNGVIWCNRTDYVFLTGIWRLYQDIINGLCKHDRYLMDDNINLQKYCESEFEYILENLITTKTKDRLDKNSANSDEKNKKTFKYSELYWHNTPKGLKHEILEFYKDYLINERKVPFQFLHHMNKLPLVKRGKGGFIRIQGIWLPRELARPLCILFAFPIRYLLVPVFGSEFPEDCKTWFYKFHSMNTDLKLTPLKLHYPLINFQSIILNTLRANTNDNTNLNKIKTQTKKKRKNNESNSVTKPGKKQNLPLFTPNNGNIHTPINLINQNINTFDNVALLPPIANLNNSVNYSNVSTPMKENNNFLKERINTFNFDPNNNTNITSMNQIPAPITTNPTIQTAHTNTLYNSGNNINYNNNGSNIANVLTPTPSQFRNQSMVTYPSGTLMPTFNPGDFNPGNNIPPQSFIFNNANNFNFINNNNKNASFNQHNNMNNVHQFKRDPILYPKPNNNYIDYNNNSNLSFDNTDLNKINSINQNNSIISSTPSFANLRPTLLPQGSFKNATPLPHGNNLVLNQKYERLNNSDFNSSTRLNSNNTLWNNKIPNQISNIPTQTNSMGNPVSNQNEVNKKYLPGDSNDPIIPK